GADLLAPKTGAAPRVSEVTDLPAAKRTVGSSPDLVDLPVSKAGVDLPVSKEGVDLPVSKENIDLLAPHDAAPKPSSVDLDAPDVDEPTEPPSGSAAAVVGAAALASTAVASAAVDANGRSTTSGDEAPSQMSALKTEPAGAWLRSKRVRWGLGAV